jgi:beta-N-acetylhexosaminidase
MNRKAIIFGIKGYRLTLTEKSFLKKTQPWGIILFSRNIKNIYQLTLLTRSIKKIFNDKKYPILIDQEGGKVSRLNKIIDMSLFSQDYFSKLYEKNKKLSFIYYKIYINAVSNILKKVGININTVPVLDVRRKKAHNIIGNRSYSSDPSKVAKLGNLCIELFMKNKIATVMKHMPGHGLSSLDSHSKTAVIKEKRNNLIKNDFKPFKECNSFFAMTAHLIYSSYDNELTATHSKIVINQIIRKHIDYKGILISDDISMKALKYGLEKNAIMALKAGCNLVLHCNGNIKEMVKLAKVVPEIDKFTKKKTSHFYNFLE